MPASSPTFQTGALFLDKKLDTFIRTLIFLLFLSHILSHLIFVMPMEVARQVDDRLLKKLKEFESTLQTVQNEVDAGGIRSDYLNGSDGWVMLFGSLRCHQPVLRNKHD
jgi:hypothetical protein